METGLLVVVSGPSGVGKGTVCKKLLQEYRALSLSVSATTRSPREGEVEGVNYFFKTREEFARMHAEHAFLESFEIYGNCYGTPKAPVERQIAEGKNVLLEIDVQGGLAVKRAMRDSVLIFLLPPSVEELASRLKGRNSENEDSYERRMASARKEMEKCNFYDYAVLNDSVDGTVCAIINIIEAEKRKTARSGPLLEDLLGGNKL